MVVEGEPEPEPEPTMNLKERCISLSPVSYVSDGDSPSSYCECIMNGFENPVPDDLIFSNINIPGKTTCGESGDIAEACGDGDIPDLSNIGSISIFGDGISLDNNVSDTYLQSVTELYNTKLNKDSEILASYIRCKEESYKPIINQFRDNATVITNFVTQNQESIKSILDSGKIEITLDKIDEFPLESITPAINQVNDIKTKLDSPLLMTAIYIIAIILLINLGFRIYDTVNRFLNR
tara:strand:- start:314 stop:1024 length:711 start_codon:yes stop_codon:yes gene_type:complete